MTDASRTYRVQVVSRNHGWNRQRTLGEFSTKEQADAMARCYDLQSGETTRIVPVRRNIGLEIDKKLTPVETAHLLKEEQRRVPMNNPFMWWYYEGAVDRLLDRDLWQGHKPSDLDPYERECYFQGYEDGANW
jgi:hypothetical protein